MAWRLNSLENSRSEFALLKPYHHSSVLKVQRRWLLCMTVVHRVPALSLPSLPSLSLFPAFCPQWATSLNKLLKNTAHSFSLLRPSVWFWGGRWKLCSKISTSHFPRGWFSEDNRQMFKLIRSRNSTMKFPPWRAMEAVSLNFFLPAKKVAFQETNY